jgi:hypothetical protein
LHNIPYLVQVQKDETLLQYYLSQGLHLSYLIPFFTCGKQKENVTPFLQGRIKILPQTIMVQFLNQVDYNIVDEILHQHRLEHFRFVWLWAALFIYRKIGKAGDTAI